MCCSVLQCVVVWIILSALAFAHAATLHLIIRVGGGKEGEDEQGRVPRRLKELQRERGKGRQWERERERASMGAQG